MGSPMSMESRTLLRLLADGEWHPLKEIYEKLALTVPPGKALRRYETKAVQWEMKYGPRKTPELSDDKKIASGQRTLANVAINSLKIRHVEITGTGDHRKIRLRPPTCECQSRKELLDPVDDEPEPAAPASEPGSAQVGFFDERKVRAIISEEVHRELDGLYMDLCAYIDKALDTLFAEPGRSRRRRRGGDNGGPLPPSLTYPK